jgi:hypothetical protein
VTASPRPDRVADVGLTVACDRVTAAGPGR